MANRPKQAGTAQESRLRDEAVAHGLPATRYEAGAPGRDVDIVADVLRVVEVKRRANLNAHKVLAETIRRWGDQHPCALVWHRLSRKGDNARRTADGPTLACLPLDDYLELLGVARAARGLVDVRGDDASVETATDCLEEKLFEANWRIAV